MELPDIGRRVLLRGQHPYAGHTGTVKLQERVGFLGRNGVAVQLDNGIKAGVLDRSDWEYVDWPGKTGRGGLDRKKV